MEGAEEELERRSNFLKSLIQKKKAIEQQEQHDHLQHNNVRVRACDMPLPLQNRAFRCALDLLDAMPPKKLDSKRLALALKKTKTFSFGRNLILHMVQLGTALWALVLAPMLLILLVVSSIFPLTKFMSFSSRQQLNH